MCTGMNGHQQTAITTHGEGTALVAPYSLTTLKPVTICPVPQKSSTEGRRPKTQDSGSLAMFFLPYALVTLLLGLLYFYRMCSFQPCKCVHIMQ